MTTVLFAERFKAAREKSGLTLKELKDRIGVSVSALSHYANGANLPPLDVAAKLAAVLGVSLDWLCGIDDESTSDFSIRNAGDYLRLLSLLLTTRVQEVLVKDQEGSFSTSGIVFGASMNDAYILIEKGRLPGHIDFSSWQKILDLHRNNEIDEEMYSAWIEKKIEALSKYPIPYKPKFYSGPIDIKHTAVETDELPF